MKNEEHEIPSGDHLFQLDSLGNQQLYASWNSTVVHKHFLYKGVRENSGQSVVEKQTGFILSTNSVIQRTDILV